jgi:hypothetical protein
MGLLDQGIDVSNIEANTAGDNTPMPEGEYTLVAETYQEKQSSNDNEMIEVTYKVTGPTHANRKIWEYFVLENTTGLGRLKSWINAAGGDATEILNRDQVNGCMGKPFLAKVVVEPGSNGYKPKNKISSFKKGSASAAAQPQAPQQAQATPAPGLNTANVDWNG